MTTKNLYDRHWRERRERQLRLHPICRLCFEMNGLVVQATVADHVTPHRGDPVLFAGPIQSLCAHHHNSWKQQMEKTGRVKGCDLNGIPIDPSHPWRIAIERAGGPSKKP